MRQPLAGAIPTKSKKAAPASSTAAATIIAACGANGKRAGRKATYEAKKMLGPLKTIWLSSERPCGKRLQTVIRDGLAHL